MSKDNCVSYYENDGIISRYYDINPNGLQNVNGFDNFLMELVKYDADQLFDNSNSVIRSFEMFVANCPDAQMEDLINYINKLGSLGGSISHIMNSLSKCIEDKKNVFNFPNEEDRIGMLNPKFFRERVLSKLELFQKTLDSYNEEEDLDKIRILLEDFKVLKGEAVNYANVPSTKEFLDKHSEVITNAVDNLKKLCGKVNYDDAEYKKAAVSDYYKQLCIDNAYEIMEKYSAKVSDFESQSRRMPQRLDLADCERVNRKLNLLLKDVASIKNLIGEDMYFKIYKRINTYIIACRRASNNAEDARRDARRERR